MLNVLPNRNYSKTRHSKFPFKTSDDLRKTSPFTRDQSAAESVPQSTRSSYKQSQKRISKVQLIELNTQSKPDVIVDQLTHDEGIKFNGTFESMKRNQRVKIFESVITPDEQNQNLLIELQRDKIHVNRLYIVIQNPKFEFEV